MTRRRGQFAALWLAIAGLAFAVNSGVILHLAPYVVMRLAEHKLLRFTERNAIFHAPLPDATSRTIVRPSPDMVYSYCVFDVSDGPVRLVAHFPPGNYWSVAAYGSNTDNFWVLNDLEAGGSPVTAVLGTAAQLAALGEQEGARLIEVPSRRGVVLFRHLLSRPGILHQIDAARARNRCEALAG